MLFNIPREPVIIDSTKENYSKEKLSFFFVKSRANNI